MERRRRARQADLVEKSGYAADQAESGGQQDGEVITTDPAVMLTCTLAAMMPLFALFLIFAEKNNRVIRHVSLQSVGLTVGHAAIAAALFLINAVFAGIPFLGFLLNLVIWIVYIVAVIVTVILRVRMMLLAWRGERFTLPVVGALAERLI